jgi:TolA-binding protein
MSSAATRLASVLCLALAACAGAEEEPAVPGRSRSAQADRPPPQTSAEEDAALDRHSRRTPRSSATIATEMQRLELRLAKSPSFATDRPQLIRRLAEGYLELEAALKEERGSPEDVKKARDKAIERYEQLEAEQPKSEAMDEALYDLALAYLRSGDLGRARQTLLNLIKRFPSSPFIARTNYAFGIAVREEAGTDPAKKELARKAFEKAAHFSKPGDPIHRLAEAQNKNLAPPPTAQVAASEPAPARPAASGAPAAAAPAPAPAPAPAGGAEQNKLGTDGTYVAEGGNYQLEAKFEPGKIIVTEPNKVSVYERQGDSRVHRYHDRALDTEYLLEIAPDGKTLFAFKPKTPNNRTRLTLRGPASTAACKGEEIPVQNDAAVNPNKERLWGTLERSTVDVTGTYLTEGGSPKLVLDKNGTGVFEMHGAPKPEYIYQVKRWWLQVNCDGTPISTDYPAAKLYWLVIDFGDRPYQGLRYKRYGVQVRSDRMVVLDRVKSR